jgi:glycosyltransferase involved in cell wall biosynthesis
MPNYNHAQYIGDALDAILSQSLRPMEVIVVDDGSTDNSVSIIERVANRDSVLRLLRNERNMGVVFSMNRAVESASGEYVCFASADDRVLPGFFEKSMNLLSQYPQAGLCCSDPVFFCGETGIVRYQPSGNSSGAGCIAPRQLVSWIRRKRFTIAGHTSVVKRSALLQAGKFIPELRWYCDWFTLLVISFRYGICYIPEPLASLREHPDSYSASGTRRWSEHKDVLAHLLKLLKSPEYADVAPAFKSTGVLSIFAPGILSLVLKTPQHWDCLTPIFLRHALRNTMRVSLSRIAPAWVKQFYRRFRDHNKTKSQPGLPFPTIDVSNGKQHFPAAVTPVKKKTYSVHT